MKLYEQRDIVAQGQKYIDHITAMTAEDLHSKADIAAELAHRDIENKTLLECCDGLWSDKQRLEANNEKLHEELEGMEGIIAILGFKLKLAQGEEELIPVDKAKRIIMGESHE